MGWVSCTGAGRSSSCCISAGATTASGSDRGSVADQLIDSNSLIAPLRTRRSWSCYTARTAGWALLSERQVPALSCSWCEQSTPMNPVPSSPCQPRIFLPQLLFPAEQTQGQSWRNMLYLWCCLLSCLVSPPVSLRSAQPQCKEPRGEIAPKGLRLPHPS